MESNQLIAPIQLSATNLLDPSMLLTHAKNLATSLERSVIVTLHIAKYDIRYYIDCVNGAGLVVNVGIEDSKFR